MISKGGERMKIGKNLSRLSIGAVLLGASLMPVQSSAEVLAFDTAWKEQGFLRLWSNEFILGGEQLQVVSDGTVSLLYRPLPRALWGARSASWKWAVSNSVVATDLTLKGGDDRNLAMYFLFVDEATAEKLSKKSALKLLRNKSTRALVYVWGGDYSRGTVLTSPYGPPSLKMVIRRSAGVGEFAEKVDLIADFKRAYGDEPGVLVGIGITADSDDTKGRIDATVSAINLL